VNVEVLQDPDSRASFLSRRAFNLNTQETKQRTPLYSFVTLLLKNGYRR
jgi:hypothetical protein